MARIKKKGLDYFPLNTDFIHDRAVRRLMKREGDSALGILVEILSYIYAGEGYYVRADRLFYEDLSAGLYEKSADDVERIVRLAVEYGLFWPKKPPNSPHFTATARGAVWVWLGSGAVRAVR